MGRRCSLSQSAVPGAVPSRLTWLPGRSPAHWPRELPSTCEFAEVQLFCRPAKLRRTRPLLGPPWALGTLVSPRSCCCYRYVASPGFAGDVFRPRPSRAPAPFLSIIGLSSLLSHRLLPRKFSFKNGLAAASRSCAPRRWEWERVESELAFAHSRKYSRCGGRASLRARGTPGWPQYGLGAGSGGRGGLGYRKGESRCKSRGARSSGDDP